MLYNDISEINLNVKYTAVGDFRCPVARNVMFLENFRYIWLELKAPWTSSTFYLAQGRIFSNKSLDTLLYMFEKQMRF